VARPTAGCHPFLAQHQKINHPQPNLTFIFSLSPSWPKKGLLGENEFKKINPGLKIVLQRGFAQGSLDKPPRASTHAHCGSWRKAMSKMTLQP
jgi:hypothetical protein